MRSGRDEVAWPALLDAALAGRPGDEAVELVGPKKSNPSRESPGFVDLGGTGLDVGSVVAGLGAGAVSSPNRSTCGARVICDGCLAVGAAARLEEAGGNFCFSWTTLNG